jgi:hypothetical protein
VKNEFLTSGKNAISGRQIAFFAAFVLPVYKLMETPSILARFAQGDLLLPAILQFFLQAGLVLALVYCCSRFDKPLFAVLEEKFGKSCAILYALYALYFLFYAILPLLDLEKFVYTAFFDTAPTLFVFAFFFILSAFVCTKHIKAVGRCADLCAFLFPLSFAVLLIMSLSQADASNLLPFFEKDFSSSLSAVRYTAPHFADALLLLPLLGNLHYQKKDGLKISLGYAGGAVCTLLFLTVFYGVFSTLAPREHYAFLKIAQYFPALTVIGRVDLLFVYTLCVVLFFFTCTPLQFSVDLIARATPSGRKTVLSGAVSLAAFLFVLFENTSYDFFYSLICEKLFFVFWIFSLLPLLLFLLKRTSAKPGQKTKGNRASTNANDTENDTENDTVAKNSTAKSAAPPNKKGEKTYG